MPRGGARPGAGRPPKHAAEEKRDRAARQLSKCKEEIQANLLDLTKAAIAEAMAGDKALLKFLLEQGIGKAPVMPTSTPDTEIKVVLGNIPRPGKAGANKGENEEDGLNLTGAIGGDCDSGDSGGDPVPNAEEGE